MKIRKSTGIIYGDQCNICHGTKRYSKSKKCVGCVSRVNNQRKNEAVRATTDFEKWQRFWFEIHGLY